MKTDFKSGDLIYHLPLGRNIRGIIVSLNEIDHQTCPYTYKVYWFDLQQLSIEYSDDTELELL